MTREDTIKLLKKEEAKMAHLRTDMAETMYERGIGAVLWGENVFGCADYPLVSDASSLTHEVHGLAMNEHGLICAVIDFPGHTQITRVRNLAPEDVGTQLTPDMMLDGGTPEEWGVLYDCFALALQVLYARRLEESPQPWW